MVENSEGGSGGLPVVGGRRLGADRWRELVSAWEASGLSQSAFCRRRGIHLKTFGRWKRRYVGVREVKSSARSDAFVEIRPPGGLSMSSGDQRPYRIVLPDGVAVEASRGFDPAELSSLLSVVRSC